MTAETSSAAAWRIIGRSSSHYTRLARLVAEEVGRPCRLQVVPDLGALDPEIYGGNPALKLPVLVTGEGPVFGVDNICRALAASADARHRIVWPEETRDARTRNAQELVWHGMQAQVQLAFGTSIAGLPADNIYFRKSAAGLDNSLRWLDENLAGVSADLPPDRDLSLFEASLFCLFEHVRFRNTAPTAAYPTLAAFARTFGQRPSAQRTPYAFDPPSGS